MALDDEKDAGGKQNSNPLGLDEAEIKLLDSQVETLPSKAGYMAIYRYANHLDLFVIATCVLLAGIAGATMPLMTVVFGSLTGKFADFTTNPAGVEAFVDQVHKLVLYFVYIGIAAFFAITLHILGFTWTAKRMSKRMRAAYLEAVLRQDVAFFDNLGAGEIATRITANMNIVQDGISEKVGLAISGLGSLIAAEIIAFITSWRLALVMLCLPVLMTLWMAIIGGRMKQAQTGSVNAYASSSILVDEVISSMRSVIANGSRHRLAKRYDASLVKPMKLDYTAKSLMGTLIGGMLSFMLGGFALSCWAGSRFMANGDVTVSQVVTVLLAAGIAGVGFGMVAPHLQAFGSAGAAANQIFAVIDRKPMTSLASGKRLDGVDGHVVFDKVKLVYPSRRHQLVLEDFSLDIPAGKTTAIVGPSGSGKSTLFSLLERFYSPLRGQILLDGHNIQDLDLQWLRSQIKVVSQETFLFNTTVFQNIAYGLVESDHRTIDDSTKSKLVEEAARIANAHAFISDLPKGYHTIVGEGGSLLSGGQRQRIAIARAVVSNPKILLLDEPTASLDIKSENAIQAGLEAAAAGRTTIVIAHRLSTVRDADKIVVIDVGRIKEQGTHDDLLARGGTFASLVADQTLRSGSDERGAEKRYDSELGSEIGDVTTPNIVDAKESITKLSPKPIHPARYELIKFIWKLNKPERGYMITGFIGSMFTGLAYPITAILFGNLVLGLIDPSLTLGGHTVSFWAGMQFLHACAMFAACLTQNIPFAHASSRLVSRARSTAFTSLLRQDAAFFTSHDSGSLAALLSLHADRLNGLSGVVLGAALNGVSAVVAGLAVAISFGWRLGLVSASTMPIIVLTGYARTRVLSDLERRNLRGDSGAAAIVSEAVRGIRSVAALGIADAVRGRYAARLRDEARSGLPVAAVLAAMYGLSQSVGMFSSALVFWYGGAKLMPSGEYTVGDFLVCLIATMYSAQAAGVIFSYAPDIAGAQEAASRLKELVEIVPEIDVDSETGEGADGIVGNVELRDVDFAYPSGSSRGEHLALKQATLRADVGRFVAVVGASGSGKSTVLGMLERFYDPLSGQVLADGLDIRRYQLQQYRKQIALVEQDAVLHGGTIQDNIITHEDADSSAIEQACRAANIWEFVQSLPDGLNTLVGSRGNQVSGGQRQRLAIARALLRNPKILLLDEATSSLDSKSEAVVQQALNAASVGRTTIAIAHRLSTVADADCIYVLENGAVVERGNHQELMAMKGKYWEYARMQSIAR